MELQGKGNTIQIRHMDIADHNLRIKLFNKRQTGKPVVSFADDLNVELSPVNAGSQLGTDVGFIVYDKHAVRVHMPDSSLKII